MKIDLREDAFLPKEILIYFDDLEERIVGEFNNLISNFMRRRNHSTFDWFLNSFSRNPHRSNLLRNFSNFYLIRNLIDDKKFIDLEVIVDNYFLYKLIKRQIDSGSLNLIYRPSLKKIIFFSLRPFLNLFYSIYRLNIQVFFAKIILKPKLFPGEYHMVDHFLYGSLKENDFLGQDDRHFPNLDDFLRQRNIDYFVFPTLIFFKNPLKLLSAFKKINHSKKNILIKEFFISISDLFKIAIIVFKSNKILFSLLRTRKKTEISELLIADLYENAFSFDFFSSLVTFFSIKKLSRIGIKISSVLDWYENQAIDKATVVSSKQFHNCEKIIGYEGFYVPRFYACKEPLDIEIDEQLIPDKIILNSRKQLQSFKHSQLQRFISGPALRFSYFNKRKKNSSDSYNVLVVLPANLSEAKYILNIIENSSKSLVKYNFIIKPHPNYISKNSIEKYIIKNNFSFSYALTSESLYSIIENNITVISTSSSFCLEALLMDVKVVLISSRSGITQNALTYFPELKNWYVAYDDKDLEKYLDKPINSNNIEFEDYIDFSNFYKVEKLYKEEFKL